MNYFLLSLCCIFLFVSCSGKKQSAAGIDKDTIPVADVAANVNTCLSIMK